MGRSRFPGKPFKFHNRKRISVLSGGIVNDNVSENLSGSCNDDTSSKDATISEETQEEEAKEDLKCKEQENLNCESVSTISLDTDKNLDQSKESEDSSGTKANVRTTRSQQKMEIVKSEKCKLSQPVKKTVTFGTVESCDDSFNIIKKAPLKSHAPLVSIIKKKSALKPSEHSIFHSIVKPAKLTDLSSKLSGDFHDTYVKNAQAPSVKSTLKFSQLTENRCISPPPVQGLDKDGNSLGRKFILPVRSAHSSRVIKPNKRFIDNEESAIAPNLTVISTAKVLKKPKLKLIFKNLSSDATNGQDEAYDTCDSSTNSSDGVEIKNNDKLANLSLSSSSLFKEKTGSLFTSNLPSQAISFQDTFVNDVKKLDQDFERDDNSSANSSISDLALEKSNHSVNDGRAGRHVLQSSRKILQSSDQSSSSGSETGETSETSDSEESSEESDDSDSESASPDRGPSSQLLSGKVILREARLQLSTNPQNNTGPEGPFSGFSSTTVANPPTTVTCGVCGAVRFYRFVKQARKFGIYSCESCRKFISKLLKKETPEDTVPTVLQCLKGEGNCHVPPVVRSQQWKLTRCANKSRCPACWLKMCLKAFQVPPKSRAILQAMLPSNMRNKSVNLQQNANSQVNPLRTNGASTLTAPQATFVNLLSHAEGVTESPKGSYLSPKQSKTQSNKKAVNETVLADKETYQESILAKDIEDKAISKKNDTPVRGSNRKRRLTRIKVRKKDKLDAKRTDSSKRQKVELKGPRVKHVCRSASIVLGQPIATFPLAQEKESDKLKMEASSSDEDQDRLQIDEKENSIPDMCTNCESTPNTDKINSDENCIENTVSDTSKDTTDKINKEIEQPKRNIEVDTEVNKKRKLEVKNLSKPESSDVDLVQEILSKKPVVKPFSNLTNIRAPQRQQKKPAGSSELICVDFWEVYDPDEVCHSGLGLISTQPFTLPSVCYLCASGGQEKLLYCASCCEAYHPFCVEAGSLGSITISGTNKKISWLCQRCVSCRACGKPGLGKLDARCQTCRDVFHPQCLTASRTVKYRSDWPQVCSSCLKCKSCDSFKVTKFLGSLPFCSSCFRLRQKGNYCPLCQGCYQDNDFDSKMMECGWCSRWVHASCEGLSGEGYQLLSALPPSIEYICKQCMPHDAPWRQMLNVHLKGKLLLLLKTLAKNKKACSLLKLTPHKNTPVPNKPFECTSPLAVRKLHFDDKMDVSETDSICGDDGSPDATLAKEKNLERMTSSSVIDLTPIKGWMPTVMRESDSGKEGDNDTTIHQPNIHKVVNLQEPLMQNKEICFSTYDVDFTEKFTATDCCVKVNETNISVPSVEMEITNNDKKAMKLVATTIHDDKYEAISDDETLPEISGSDPSPPKTNVHIFNPQSSSVSFYGTEMSNFPSTSVEVTPVANSPSLLDIKKRVNANEYFSLKEFNGDMKDVIRRTLSTDLKTIYESIFKDTFPWFDCEANCLNPELEIADDNDDTESLKDEDIVEATGRQFDSISSLGSKNCDQIVPKLEDEAKMYDDYVLGFDTEEDTRICILCKSQGDGAPTVEGRLLYCGQNDWIHANCALWSAEVYEEIDGSLQNVHSAISRGKMIKCADCDVKGASVGCCAKNCSETYHYACARRRGCAFMDDKRVFCPTHAAGLPDRTLQRDADFELARPVYVELDRKKKKYGEISKVQFLMGSLTVQSLGKIIPSVSDYEEYLIPVDFTCDRLYWSSKQPWKIVKYTITTKLVLAEPVPGFDLGVNITLDHSTNPGTVDRIIAEINSWHRSLDGGCPAALMLKKDKSPSKYSAGLTLEELAVQQVVEHLLDIVCRPELPEDAPDEEPQSTADLLPPELKDAIFEDLNHDLLDGISMQDIFPKLMSYEDLVVMDLKNEYFSSEPPRANVAQGEEARPGDGDPSGPRCRREGEARATGADLIDDLLNTRSESTSRELKRSKSDAFVQGNAVKALGTNRSQQRSCSLTWNCKFESNVLSLTSKRCKISRPTPAGRGTSLNSTGHVDLSPEVGTTVTRTKIEETQDEKKSIVPRSTMQLEGEHPQPSADTLAHASSDNRRFHETPGKEKSIESIVKPEEVSYKKNDGFYEEVIDFYTKIQCSPIAQLDGTNDDISCSESECSSPPMSPREDDFTPIPQLDGAEENAGGTDATSPHRNQNSQFFYRTSGADGSYTISLPGNVSTIPPEMLMRSPADDSVLRTGVMEQTVRCDRCQCTYRNRESYDRHVQSCDMMSTSESEGETPKSPESRTLTTLQNAFQGSFAQPVIISHPGTVDAAIKPEGISSRRSSVNTRQITINGTIVETQSPGPNGSEASSVNELKTNTVILDQSKITSNHTQLLPTPQIVVSPQMPLMPPKPVTPNQKTIVGPQIICSQPPGMLPYNICVKTGPNSLQQIPGGQEVTQLITSNGQIQVLSSNPNQVLTIPQQQNISSVVQGKTQTVHGYPNIASASSISLPVNQIQGIPNSIGNHLIHNIQPMIRPQIQQNPTIVVPTATTQRLTSPNSQHKTQMILPQTPQKSPKKQTQVQPKPIFQATRGRGRAVTKTTSVKRQTKVDKAFQQLNQTMPLGPNNAVIQLQHNPQPGQPSIIVQPMANQSLVSAYVEALSQQQNQNMQYIATITPQGDFKAAPTQFISQGGIVPQTFQIQQTESGGLVAVPSGGIPVILPQGNVGILPQAHMQQGTTILPQGTIQTPSIISQGPNGATILPQTAIHSQNGTIIPQGTIQGLSQGNISSQTATLLPNNTIQTQGTTIVPQSGIGNTTAMIPQSALQSQGSTLISQTPGTAILPQGTILPQGMQFCNDQVILGSTPTLEMVTDPSGCMYLTTTQPVYYGLETIVQNTVMSSQQFVSTAMQGVLAQNSSFSATTTQVFQASKIEPIVEVPAGYVVVNNVQDNASTSQAGGAAQTLVATPQANTPQSQKNMKQQPIPNITLQPMSEKPMTNRQPTKVVQPVNQPTLNIGPQTLSNVQAIRPVGNITTSQTSMAPVHIVQRNTQIKPSNITLQGVPSVTLVSSTGQPIMAISQSVTNNLGAPHSVQCIPMTQPIVSSSIAPTVAKNQLTSKHPHVMEIGVSNQDTPGSPLYLSTSNMKNLGQWRPSNAPTIFTPNDGAKITFSSSGNDPQHVISKVTIVSSPNSMGTMNPPVSVSSRNLNMYCQPFYSESPDKNTHNNPNTGVPSSVPMSIASISNHMVNQFQDQSVNSQQISSVHGMGPSIMQVPTTHVTQVISNLNPNAGMISHPMETEMMKMNKINAGSVKQVDNASHNSNIVNDTSQVLHLPANVSGLNDKMFGNQFHNQMENNKNSGTNINLQTGSNQLQMVNLNVQHNHLPHNQNMPVSMCNQLQVNHNTNQNHSQISGNNQNQMNNNNSLVGAQQHHNMHQMNSGMTVNNNIHTCHGQNSRVNISNCPDNTIQALNANNSHLNDAMQIQMGGQNQSNVNSGVQMMTHENHMSIPAQMHVVNNANTSMQTNRQQFENNMQQQNCGQIQPIRQQVENNIAIQQHMHDSGNQMQVNRPTMEANQHLPQHMNGMNGQLQNHRHTDQNIHMQQQMNQVQNIRQQTEGTAQIQQIMGGHQMHRSQIDNHSVNINQGNIMSVNNQNSNRQQVEGNNLHMQQISAINNQIQNNRPVIDGGGSMNIGQQMSNMNSQIGNNRQHMEHSNVHMLQQMNNSMVNSRQQMESGSAHMQTLPMVNSIPIPSPMSSVNNHLQTNRQQMDNNLHIQQQMSNMNHQTMNNRQQIENNLHLQQQMPGSIPNQMTANRQQIDNSNSHMPLVNISNQMHRQSGETNLNMQPPIVHNTMHNRQQMEVNNAHLQHNMQNSCSINTNLNNQNIQNNSQNHMNMGSNLMHHNINNQGPVEPKNDSQVPCSGSCVNNTIQISNDQLQYDMCNNQNQNLNNNSLQLNSNNTINQINSPTLMNNNLNSNAHSMIHSMPSQNTHNTNTQMLNNQMYMMNNSNSIMSGNQISTSCNNSSHNNNINLMQTNNVPNQMLAGPQVPMNNTSSQIMNTGGQMISNHINNMPINVINNQMPHTQIQVLDNQNMGPPARPPINERMKFMPETNVTKMTMMSQNNNVGPHSMQTFASTESVKANATSNTSNEKPNHTISVSNQLGYLQMNSQNNRIINLPERNHMNINSSPGNIAPHMNQSTSNLHVINTPNETISRNINANETMTVSQPTENTNILMNTSHTSINNTSLNLNLNTTNTINITPIDNAVEQKIPSKTVNQINLPIHNPPSVSQNQNNSNNLICLPTQNTINLPTQSSSSISLPKAPTHQSGIPTNVVNPMSMRPMNRVLPLHRDGQVKSSSRSTIVPKPPTPRRREPSQDMPDLNIKEDVIADSDLEKAIEESKRMMELERKKQKLQDGNQSAELQESNLRPVVNTISVEEKTPEENGMIVTEDSEAGKDEISENMLKTQSAAQKRSIGKEEANIADPKVENLSAKPTKKLSSEKKNDGNSLLSQKKIQQQRILKQNQENINNIAKSQQSSSKVLMGQGPQPPKDDGPKLIFEVMSEDGFTYSSTSLTDLWGKVLEAVQGARKHLGLTPVNYVHSQNMASSNLLGLHNNALRYLVEQLPGASRCVKYKTKQGRKLMSTRDSDVGISEGFKESPWGCARVGPVSRKSAHDMFSWLASQYRDAPPPLGAIVDADNIISRRLTSSTLPMAMRFRHLKETSKVAVGVYRSLIHGRGLFCRRDIEAGEMVIEYAGEVIRAVLADQREKSYEAMRGRHGISGCYMFRIDDHLVVDATLKGNAARFINHSCDPNCYSRVVDILGHKHILIFALRRINQGEELTYDYKFPFEEVKIPCTCGAKKCRKYLN